jgi:4-hydroxy-tetrahydrodipicolinate synthase
VGLVPTDPGLGALLTAIVTPFDDGGDVDEEAFRTLHRRVCEEGSHGIVVAGTTGEAPTLTDAEHLRLIEIAVDGRPDGTTVVAGTGSNDTRHACEMTERATELGVDGILSVTPYYNRPNRRGILAHFAEVDRATDRPIVLYNIPARTATDMPNDLLAEIAELEHVCAVKQANNANLAPVDGLDLYAGNDEILARTLAIGGVGGICVASHVAGDRMRRMIDEPDRRDAIDAELQPLFAALAVATNPIAIKTALGLLGVCSPRLRLPMVDADERERETIRAALEAQGLIGAAAS